MTEAILSKDQYLNYIKTQRRNSSFNDNSFLEDAQNPLLSTECKLDTNIDKAQDPKINCEL